MGCSPFANSHFQMGVTVMGFAEHFGLSIKCPSTGWKCGIGEKDDNRYKECDPEKVPNPEIDFMKVKDVNSWYFWLLNTLKPNVRVQEWYNGKPPYGLRGYLDDKANR